MSRPILEAIGLNKHFGGIYLTNNVNFVMAEGEQVAPIVVQQLGLQIRKLKDMGLTIFFSEKTFSSRPKFRTAPTLSKKAVSTSKARSRN